MRTISVSKTGFEQASRNFWLGLLSRSASVDVQLRPVIAQPSSETPASLNQPSAQAPVIEDQDLAGCAMIEGRNYVSEINVMPTPWTQLNRGQASGEYALSADGSLLYQEQMLAHSVPVSGTSGPDGDKWTYAQSITLSPKSPTGRFALLQGCEERDSKGLCWTLFVVNLSNRRIERTNAGKYGPAQWIAWIGSTDEHAILRYESEGARVYYRVHLATGGSAECSPWRPLSEAATTAAAVPAQPMQAKPRNSITAATPDVDEAKSLFSARRYAEALHKCEQVLRDDPQNRSALLLKDQIEKTMRVLGVTC